MNFGKPSENMLSSRLATLDFADRRNVLGRARQIEDEFNQKFVFPPTFSRTSAWGEKTRYWLDFRSFYKQLYVLAMHRPIRTVTAIQDIRTQKYDGMSVTGLYLLQNREFKQTHCSKIIYLKDEFLWPFQIQSAKLQLKKPLARYVDQKYELKYYNGYNSYDKTLEDLLNINEKATSKGSSTRIWLKELYEKYPIKKYGCFQQISGDLNISLLGEFSSYFMTRFVKETSGVGYQADTAFYETQEDLENALNFSIENGLLTRSINKAQDRKMIGRQKEALEARAGDFRRQLRKEFLYGTE